MVGLAAADTFGFDLTALQHHADRVGPTPTHFGQITDDDPSGARLEARWAPVKSVGRHWLTDHDFPLID
jgi:hypothetical protein